VFHPRHEGRIDNRNLFNMYVDINMHLCGVSDNKFNLTSDDN